MNPAQVVAHVLPSSKFLRNVGLEPASPKRSATPALVQELEAEVGNDLDMGDSCISG